ncbi:Aspartate/glutamate/uridylate kinase [Favolaschia claudopus]|uniref:aspartate kinase n=1 Tax=Favolaschia claudopus TaxID=2862362 RepID=A0AAW0E7N4_9AGAR
MSQSSDSSSCSSSPTSSPTSLQPNNIDPSSRWLVQKFGGTSVGRFAVNIARDIVPDYIGSNKVAIVCSARSESSKALGTTNLLLRAASETLRSSKNSSGTATPISASPVSERAGLGSWSPTSPRSPRGRQEAPADHSDSPPPFLDTVDLIREQHLKAARASVQDPGILDELEAEIEQDCEWLRTFLYASHLINEISPRGKDTIVGLGERLMCKIMTAVLRDQGVDAEFVSLENILDDLESHEEDDSLDQDFYDRLSMAVGERVKQCESRVPVVTGFFGPVPGSLLQQIGRGYTDLLAALLAVGLQASELQVWKDVDGIFTADPRKVPTARLISVISPAEAAELTYYGSEVIHPFTMDQAIRRKIPIRIKNVKNPRGGGTVIHPDAEGNLMAPVAVAGSVPEAPSLKLALLSARALQAKKHYKHPTAVTIKERIIVLNVNSNRKSVSHGFLAGIFGTLDRYGVVVDLISTSEVHVSMAIEENGLNKKIMDRLVRQLQHSGTVSVHTNMAILSLVGQRMCHNIGVAGRMFDALAQGKINIEMISQGASEINISCVIDEKDAVKALNVIHYSCLQTSDF